MRRYAVPFVIVASTAILVALVVLWRSISGISEPPSSAPPERAPSSAQPAPPPSSPTAGTPTPASPGASRAIPLPQIQRRPSGTEATPRPSFASDGESSEGSATPQNIQWGIPQMRAQVTANEGKVNECLAQATTRGDKPSGDVTLTFIAAKKGDKIVIEDTSYDHDATTLKNESLVECLHATSKAMTFEGLPRGANAVFVTRTVKVENGALVENKLVKFSYIH